MDRVQEVHAIRFSIGESAEALCNASRAGGCNAPKGSISIERAKACGLWVRGIQFCATRRWRTERAELQRLTADVARFWTPVGDASFRAAILRCGLNQDTDDDRELLNSRIRLLGLTWACNFFKGDI